MTPSLTASDQASDSRFGMPNTDTDHDERTSPGFNLESIRHVKSRYLVKRMSLFNNPEHEQRLTETQLGSKISEAQGRAKRRLRKAVTGNPDKKVREYNSIFALS